MRVIAQPIPTTPAPTAPVNLTPIVPTPTVATTSTQMPMVKSAAMSIPVMVCNLAKGKFGGIPYPTERHQAEEIPSVHNSNCAPLKAIPNAPTFQVREDTLGLTQSQPPQTYLKPRQIDQFPLHQYPLKHKCHPNSSDPPCHGFSQTNQRRMYMVAAFLICIKEEEEGMKDLNGDRQRDQPKNHHPQNA